VLTVDETSVQNSGHGARRAAVQVRLTTAGGQSGQVHDSPDDGRRRSPDVAALAKRLLEGDRPANEVTPSQFLERIVVALNATREPNEELIRWIGCGELENLIRDHGEELWSGIERFAREDARFRRALRSVWAYDSPEFRRREALLEELGEFRSTWIRFVVQPNDLSGEPGLSWRAIELEGSVSKRELAPLLRSIARWCEREEPDSPGPTDGGSAAGPRAAEPENER
jgi:hypothetical protein